MPSGVLKPESESSPSPKPVNVFYVWYGELCRRLSMQTLSIVKPAKPKSETVLDFVVDRIKPEEWPPVLNALRFDSSLHVIAVRSRVQCKFLHDVDTEEKAKHMKRRAGSLYTTYVLNFFLKSLSSCIRRNNVLSSLELDGIPLAIDNIEPLLEALKKNKTIKVLSIKYCTIRDLGCQLLCNALRLMPNIEILNLTACGLGSLSAQYIAKVVKYQQINRYCESWHNSLRYEDPIAGIMAGLKRITLNNNPNIGDEGLIYILDELDDDLWIKALDMQRCGVTENIASRLLDVINYSKSLEVADFRGNERLAPGTVEKILEILKRKQKLGYDNEFQWCLTATTLQPEGSVKTTVSTTSTKIIPLKSRSVPSRNIPSNTNTIAHHLRRMKTCTAINNKIPEKYTSDKNRNLIEAKNNVLSLNEELQKEVAKRVQSELENKRLKQELEKIKTSCNLTELAPHKDKVVKFDPVPQKRPKPKSCKKPPTTAAKGGGGKVEFIFENKNQAHNILQNLVNQKGHESEPETDMKEYFEDILDDGDGSSNSSLIKFMNDLQQGANENGKERKSIWNNNSDNCFRKVSVR